MARSKNTVSRLFALGLVALVVAVAVVEGGCGNVISAGCDQKCTCETCSDAERKSCEDEGAADQQKAESLGCTTQLDAYTSCFNGANQCPSSGGVAGLCEKQEAALAACTKGFVPFRDACELATDRLVACGIRGDPGPGGTKPLCTGALRCNAICINAATCPALVDAFTSGMPGAVAMPFLACTTQCATAP